MKTSEKSIPRQRDCRGEAALLEISVILPMVFLAVTALLMLAIWLCDACAAERIADKYAFLGAAEYVTPGYAVTLDQYDPQSEDPLGPECVKYLCKAGGLFRRVFGEPESMNGLEQKMAKELTAVSVLDWETKECCLEVDRGLTGEYVTATVVRSPMPDSMLGWLLPDIRASAKCRATGYAELVRNTDLLSNAAEDVFARLNGKDFFKKLFQK